MKCLIVLAGELATARATSAAGTIMVLILSPPLSHTLLDIFLKGSLVLFLTRGKYCFDNFFRHYLHGLRVVLRKLLPPDLGFAFSNSM